MYFHLMTSVDELQFIPSTDHRVAPRAHFSGFVSSSVKVFIPCRESSDLQLLLRGALSDPNGTAVVCFHLWSRRLLCKSILASSNGSACPAWPGLSHATPHQGSESGQAALLQPHQCKETAQIFGKGADVSCQTTLFYCNTNLQVSSSNRKTVLLLFTCNKSTNVRHDLADAQRQGAERTAPWEGGCPERASHVTWWKKDVLQGQCIIDLFSVWCLIITCFTPLSPPPPPLSMKCFGMLKFTPHCPAPPKRAPTPDFCCSPHFFINHLFFFRIHFCNN